MPDTHWVASLLSVLLDLVGRRRRQGARSFTPASWFDIRTGPLLDPANIEHRVSRPSNDSASRQDRSALLKSGHARRALRLGIAEN